jgi:hypothetical protein
MILASSLAPMSPDVGTTPLVAVKRSLRRDCLVLIGNPGGHHAENIRRRESGPFLRCSLARFVPF